MSATKIKAVIFDCFGVIITDGLELISQELEKTDPDARIFIRDMIRSNNLGHISPKECNQKIADHFHISVDEWVRKVRIGEVKDQRVIQWIGELKRQYKTALLSNVALGSLKRRFSDEELSEYFDVIVVSAEVGMIKPDPDIYHLTAQRLGLQPAACVFIDDRQKFCTAAQAVGMQAIFYQTYQQAKRELTQLLKLQEQPRLTP